MQSCDNLQTFVWWGASLCPHPHHTDVCKISHLRGAISSLVFNKLLSDLAMSAILRRSFQWWRRMFRNLSMSKVEKKRGRISVLKSYAGHQHRAVNFLQFCLEHNLNFKAKGCWRKTLLGRRILNISYSSSFLDLHLDSMKTLGTVILFVVNGSFLSLLSSRQTEGYSGSDLTALARDAALGPIRGEKWLQ